MKFCYVDESGTGDEPYAVMVGVIVDSQRMHLTKSHWAELLTELSRITGRAITEIHTREFYPGNGPWRGIGGPQRAEIITTVFNWLKERKHHIVYTAVDKEKFYEEFQKEPFYKDIRTLWTFMATHIALSVQKHYQGYSKNKGNTVLVFDNEAKEEELFTEIILRPPSWTDSYYSRNKKLEPLDQVVDVPYFVDSQHVGLIQVADFICYFMRLFIELHEKAKEPKYKEERERIDQWMETAFSRSIPKSCILPAIKRCDCADLFYRYAPSCMIRWNGGR